jgi:diamine N-acetyltransferase
MEITVATVKQLHIVKELAYSIWPVTYGEIISETQLDYMLSKMYNLETLENLLLQKNQIFLLLKENTNYVGFCSYELNCNQTSYTKLHKIYVLPEMQGKGAGKLLLLKVEEIAKKSNNTSVFLNVNRFNKAQEFYKKNNYIITNQEDINIGNGYLMEDYVMEKKLV